jgi:hypothetical protein
MKNRRNKEYEENRNWKKWLSQAGKIGWWKGSRKKEDKNTNRRYRKEGGTRTKEEKKWDRQKGEKVDAGEQKDGIEDRNKKEDRTKEKEEKKLT